MKGKFGIGKLRNKVANVTRRYRDVNIGAVTILLGLLAGLFSFKEPLLGFLLVLAIVALLAVVYIFFKDGNLSFHRVVVPLLIATILFPPIRLPAGIPAVRLELIVVLVGWTLLFLGHLATRRIVRLRRNPMYKWFILFGLAILLSMTYAALAKGYLPNRRDFWELGKLLEYFLIFALVGNLDISPTRMKRYYGIALIVLLCSALVGFAQYLNLGNINTVVSPYYAPTKLRGLLVYRQITGTMSDPIIFGALMTLASSLALSGALFFETRARRLFSWVCLPLFGMATVLTLSRSALISTAVAVSFILLFKYPLIVGARRSLRHLLIVIPVAVVIGLAIAQLAPDRFFVRVAELKDITGATSWQARLAIWKDSFALWKESPLLGWGPGKATMTTQVHNEWLLLMRRYGLVGVLIFVAWFVNFYSGVSRIRRGTPKAAVRALTVALQATLISYAVYMIPQVVYHSLQLFPILLVFLGLAYSQSRTKSSVEVGGSRP